MAAQLADIIIMDGEERNLYSNPLEQYWISLRKRRPSFCQSSDCRRGYIATWEIKDKRLFLTDVWGNFERRSFFKGKQIVKCSLKTVFETVNEKMKADWFSGKLRIPNGPMTLYEHNEYDSRFEKEIIITVEQGVVTKIVTLDYTLKALNVN